VDSPDVQASASPRPYRLTRVGVRGVRKPVTVQRPGQAAHGVVVTFDMFVDLPAKQKGTHMSRNLEALADVLDEVIAKPTRGLENLCRRLVEQLLERHEYARDADVKAEADYFLTRTNPGGKPTVEHYRVLAQAFGERGKPVRRQIGVKVVGMSACPCAMETARHHYKSMGKEPDVDVPFITHNQRNVVTLVLEVPEDGDVEAGDLVDICEAALSAPTYELLKRGDEGQLVIRAHESPRFVEDVVREALHLVKDRYERLGNVEVFVSSEAEESIHKHNAYAEMRLLLEDL
jgi:GTP cyclohydrolase IV